MLTLNSVSFPTVHAHNSHASPARRGQHTGGGHYRPSRSGPSPIQTIDTTSNGHTHPVVIHLAPPPPPRTRRHRVDALGTAAAPVGLLGLPSSKVNRYSNSESNDSHGAHTASTSNSDRSAFSDAQMNHGSGHILHDVSYTYLHATQENEQPSHHNQPHSHQPHHQNPQFYNMPRNLITLAYEPPKLRRSLSGRSLIETTETEERVDLELELEDDQDGNSNVDLESEMHRALSRTSSMASSAMSGAEILEGQERRLDLQRPKKQHPDRTLSPAKRKKFFGWEFGWDPLPKQRSRGSGEMKEVQDASFLDFRGVRRKDSDKMKDKDVKVPMTPTKKLKRYSTPAGAMHHRTMSGREAAKMEKLEDLLGIGVGLTSMDSTTSDTSKKLKKRSKSVTRSDEAGVSEQQPLVPDQLVRSTPQSAALSSGLEHRKVKSTSTSASSGGATSRPGTADSKTSSNRSHKSSASFGTRSSMRRDGFGLQLKKSFKLGVGRTLGPNLTLASAGLAYSRSDEMNWRARKASGRDSLGDQERSVDTQEENDDVHSVAAAKLVSASIARVMPAVTILTVPSSPTTPSPTAQSTVFQSSLVSASGVAYPPPGPATRPALTSIITSLPIPISVVKAAPSSAPGFTTAASHVYSPQNSKAPRTSGSTWRSHPLTNPADESAHPLVRTLVTIAPIELGTSSPEDDDVVQLEREMEESRRQSGDVRGDGGLDSPSAPFKELAAFAGGLPDDVSVSASPPEPLTNASLTPSLNSIFAHAQTQAQTAAMPSLPTTTQKAAATPEKIKGGLFGRGHTQKRMPLSAPPVTSKMERGPQSSGIDANTGSSSAGLPYKFPLIFPHSFSNSSSLPGSNSVGYTNQQPQSTPSTPKGVSSTLRLSSMTMGTVRNVFAGVGARMSSATIRMSVNGAPAVNGSRKSKAGLGHGFGEMVMEAGEGDFMDLRDPFAPPPPSGRNKVDGEIERLWEIDSGLVHGPGGLNVPGDEAGVTGPRRRMSSWGKLPMPARPISPALSAVNGNVSGASTKKTIIGSAQRAARIVGKPSRKHKKKSRRSAMLSSANGGIKPGEEDEDFGLEEALLSQRLLNRLDADGWEVQT
ncbi:hypothetical protein CPB84DRAFT_1294641 [Gymnopilus junonius]|uniref:Uncharacterized protein n=1 Tax=Gymnopilus junonius TaxID=109634 RepID=A0A9P5TKU1_GYMJU|nr:hypothetical protein CPB84DRAFT_1294641 [Gymnopilus junonius]